MKTDKHLHVLLASSPEMFYFLTGGITLTGPYRARSVTFKALERRVDQIFEPEDDTQPVYLIEVQRQRSGDVYDRLVTELSLYRHDHPGRPVFGLVLFWDASCDELDSPWRECVGRGPLLPPVYLDEVLELARREQPAHPLLAAFLPLVATDQELAQRAPAAWRQLNVRVEPDARALMDVFMSWLMERHKQQSYEEVMTMLQVLTPLEETRAYQELVGIGMEKGIQKGMEKGRQEGMAKGQQTGRSAILTKLLRRRFGELPDWAIARLECADPEQLEWWAEQIFDAPDLTALLDSHAE